jgi:ADP-heptose:LPS heptosyltransferase
MGDLMCIIPTVRAIRQAYPAASISLIGLRWQKEFVERFGHYFDDFVEFPGWPGLPEQPIDPKRIVTFLDFMQSQSYDLVVQMQGNGVITNTLSMLFGAKKVCGLRKANEYCPDDKLFPVSEDTENEVLRFLKLAGALEIPTKGEWLEFPFIRDELSRVERIIDGWGITSKRYICVHPGARDPKRRWPAEHFASVADRLSEQGYVIVLTGSQAERDLLGKVSHLMKHPCINSVHGDGELSLGELAGVIKHAAALLSNDTGVSHIASALEIPSVILFSTYSSPERWAPLDSRLHKTILPVESWDHTKVFSAVLNVIKQSAAAGPAEVIDSHL